MKTKLVYRTNALKKLAEDYVNSPYTINNSEIELINITDIFERELYQEMLINRESINCNINAKVRMGKSTVMLALAKNVQDSMCRLGFTTNKWSIFNIARTTYELSKKMRDSRLNNIIIGVDEFDDLDETQVNSTIEQALLHHFSKIQAGRYIHRIYCSPANMPDSGSDIQILIDQPNKQTRKTKCYVYYRLQKGDIFHTQLIGHIIVDVAPIIKNWVDAHIEEKFYKFNKTKEDEQFINFWRKRDWYVDYMVRKFMKMDMVNKMGIFQARTLDYSDIFLECVRELKPYCKIRGLITQKQVKNKLKILFRKHVIPTSMAGDVVMPETVDGILDFYKNYYELIDRREKLRSKTQTSEVKMEIDLINDSIKMVLAAAKEQEEELEILSKLKKDFYDEN